MSYNAGVAYIDIRPSFENFQSDIKAEMAKQGDQAGQAFSDAFKAEVDGSLADLHASIKADADTSALDAELDEAAQGRTARIEADADTGEASADLDELTEPRAAQIGLDASDLEAKAAAADAELDDVTRDRTATIGLDDDDLIAKGAADDALLDDVAQPRTAPITADDSAAKTVVQELQRQVAVLTAQKNNIDISSNASTTGVQIATLLAQIDKLQDPAQIQLAADDAAAKATIDELQLKIDVLTAQRNDIEIGVDATRAELEIATLEAELEALRVPEQIDISAGGDTEGMSPLIMGIAAGLFLLGPAALGATAAVVGVGAAFGAAAMTGGGFSAVTQRLEGDLMNGAESASGFGSALQSVGSGSMEDFDKAAMSAGQAVGTLFVTFGPDIEKAAGLVEEIAADFDKWAKSVTSSGLDSFLSKAFSPQELSDLKSDFDDIVKIIGTLGKVEQAIQPFAMNGLTDILNALAKLDPTKVELLLALFAGVKALSMIGSAGAAIGKMIDSIDYVLNGPDEGEATAAGAETGEAFAAGVKEGAATAGSAGEVVAAELAAGAPEAGIAGAETGEAYAAGIEGAAAIGTIGAETAAELAAGAPEAAIAGAETGAAYAEGLDGAAAIGAIGEETAAELAGGAPEAAMAGGETGAAYAEGFDGAAAAGIGAGVEEAAGELDIGATEGAAAGAEMGAGFDGGFAGAIAGVAEIVTEAAGEMSALAMEGGMEAGEMLSAGFAAGILEGLPEVLAAATEVAEVAEAAMAAVLLAESPSKVTRELGVWTGLGFAYGMTDTLADVAGAARSLADASVSSLAHAAAAESLASFGAVGTGSLAHLPGDLGSGALELKVSYAGASDQLTNEIVKSLRFSIQAATGGDVQAHLGRGKVRT